MFLEATLGFAEGHDVLVRDQRFVTDAAISFGDLATFLKLVLDGV